jgi:hypothetical protein
VKKKKKKPSQLSLELFLEFFKDDHTIDSMSLRKIMQSHQYTNSSKFHHRNLRSHI